MSPPASTVPPNGNSGTGTSSSSQMSAAHQRESGLRNVARSSGPKIMPSVVKKASSTSLSIRISSARNSSLISASHRSSAVFALKMKSGVGHSVPSVIVMVSPRPRARAGSPTLGRFAIIESAAGDGEPAGIALTDAEDVAGAAAPVGTSDACGADAAHPLTKSATEMAIPRPGHRRRRTAVEP